MVLAGHARLESDVDMDEDAAIRALEGDGGGAGDDVDALGGDEGSRGDVPCVRRIARKKATSRTVSNTRVYYIHRQISPCLALGRRRRGAGGLCMMVRRRRVFDAR